MKNLTIEIVHKIMAMLGRLRIYFTCFLISSGCMEEKVDVVLPEVGPVTLQMHNFNSLGSKLYDGTAPYIHYFVQKTDGSFAFTMSMDKSRWTGIADTFETDWANKYIYVNMNDEGIITSSFPKSFNTNGGFETIDVEMPNQYKVVGNKLIYSRWNFFGGTQQINMALNPESGVAKTFATYLSVDPSCPSCPQSYAIHPTTNGNFVTINHKPSGTVVYSFFSAQGNLFYDHDLATKNTGSYDYYINYFSHFITERNGEYYFLNVSTDTTQNHWYDLSYPPGISTFYIRTDFPSSIPPNYDVKIHFGPNHSQKAYRYISESDITPVADYIYRDLVDVPFEVWDVTNDRQLNVAFNDLNKNGGYSLGDIILIAGSNYSMPPENSSLAENGAISNFFIHMVASYWYNTPTTVFIQSKNRPTGLVKINAQGISEIGSEILKGPFPVRTIHDVLPYNNGGFAVLCNTSRYWYVDDKSADLILLNENFDVEQFIEMGGDDVTLEKIVSNDETILYCALKGNASLQLTSIKNGVTATRNLDDLGQYIIENYKVTPTLKGGWAILAWVWQTPNTRDLLFMELDENLNLVKN